MRYNNQRLDKLTDLAIERFTFDEDVLKAIEEAYELLEALKANDDDDIKEELIDNIILNYRFLKHLRQIEGVIDGVEDSFIYYKGNLVGANVDIADSLCYLLINLIDILQNGGDLKSIINNLSMSLKAMAQIRFMNEREFYILLNKKLDKFEFKYLKVAT